MGAEVTEVDRGEAIMNFGIGECMDYYENRDVREFYNEARSGNTANLYNLIPQSVVNKINTKVGLKSKFYRYISVTKVKGKGKVAISNDKT